MPDTQDTLHQAIDQLVAELQDLWARQSKRRIGERDIGPLKASLSQIVTDALQAQSANLKHGMASIHKSAGHYTQGRYWSAPYGYKLHIQRSYAGLISLGYIEECKKGVYTDYARLLTRYRATDRLLNLFANDITSDLAVFAPARTNQETIRLNVKQPDGHKALIDYADTAHTRQMREAMTQINSCLLRSWADLELDERQLKELKRQMISSRTERTSNKDGDGVLRLQDRTLYRVFNDEHFTTNGRLYGGWWQSIPRDFRQFILINGKRTVELDYSGLHPNLAYSMSGSELKGDPYELEIGRGRSPEFRNTVKKAFNAMLNADHELVRAPRGIDTGSFDITWRQLKAAIYERHAPIAGRFFSAIGAHLQNIDSEVAVRVLRHFADMGVAVLPVHDSFIMHSGYENELRDVMQAALKTVAGVSVPIQLSQSNASNPNGFTICDDDFESLLRQKPYQRHLDHHRAGLG
jgi:hypothetical protein